MIRRGSDSMDETAMWTPTTRAQHSRSGLRYGSDVTDREWVIHEPLLPQWAGVGRRPAWPMREIVNAIFHVLRGGIARRLLPDSFPPWHTLYRWFARLRNEGIWENLNHRLVMLDRERAGRGKPDRRHRQPERQDHGEWRAAWLRCGQEGQGTQAARDGGHGRPSAEAAGSLRRGAGSRRRRAASAGVTRSLAVRPTRLCRCRLQRR